MKRCMFSLGAFLILLILSLSHNTKVFAEDSPKHSEHKECFVDLDGDGFNDNTNDFENNRFATDETTKENEAGSMAEGDCEKYVSFDSGADTDVSVYLTNSEKFGLLKFTTRGLDGCRGESESGFGGNMGAMGGSGQSGGCAGGACIAD